MNLRQQALNAIIGVKLPGGWDPLTPHRKWERWTHRREDGEITGQLHLQAMLARPGGVIVGGHGCEIHCNFQDVREAVDHVLAWMDRNRKGDDR